jgi:hypothetical protein
MYKKIICIGLLNGTMMYGITLGPNLVTRSSSDYLLDFAHGLNNSLTTRQIGQILCERNYIDYITPHDHIIGRYDANPSSLGYEYPANEGMWIWIADCQNSDTGTWYWILKTMSAYLTVLLNQNMPT